ncbi:AbfB domain-containing protein [Actinoplanes sp. NPDC023801]|uniref:AbfB domain-containing protein n=1 Tax=Actinoplanes sp. NPDC023801 TaxID=3154595 RepID=UPI0033CF230D
MTTVPRTVPRTSARISAGTTAYAFAYFTETPSQSGANYGLHLAVSRDGLHWSPLNQNQPVTTPTAGQRGLRDPYIHRRQDGTFVVAATDLKGLGTGPGSQYLHIWDSTDLASFTGYRHVRMHTMNTHIWSPAIFWDAGRREYGIAYSSANGTRDVLMVNYTTDFRTVSAPQVYFDPGSPLLDAGARRPGAGAFSPAGHGFDAWAPGDVGGGAWMPRNQRDHTPPLNAKAGSTVGITDAEYHAMVSRWGLPDWTRLKSWNHPDRFVRHYNGSIRLDTHPFDPHQDQLWRAVTGLAGSGVSFESVNRPGHYLRHSGTQIRLDPVDGTAGFRADATFLRGAGLADPGWTSLRSYNMPTHHLRHSGYVLRLDPVGAASSTTDRQDATFRFVS